jgi:hypothetical protein
MLNFGCLERYYLKAFLKLEPENSSRGEEDVLKSRGVLRLLALKMCGEVHSGCMGSRFLFLTSGLGDH